MSSLGDMVRLDAATAERLRTDPKVYDFLTGMEPPERLDLDKAWSRLAALIDAAGAPVNPITGGTPFPDPDLAWGDAYALIPAQVAEAAAALTDMPFGHLQAHLGAVLEAEDWTNFDGDPTSPTFMEPLPGPVIIPEETVRDISTVLAARYAELVPFLREAAANGQAVIFWAA